VADLILDLEVDRDTALWVKMEGNHVIELYNTSIIARQYNLVRNLRQQKIRGPMWPCGNVAVLVDHKTIQIPNLCPRTDIAKPLAIRQCNSCEDRKSVV